MPEIRALSASMINKIAAGEVIERPASVVKELVENSIDAGATRIEINIEKSGFDLIRIVDNGCGISKDQLQLALSPHATSKIADAEDLFKIKTLGFRGEALASIAEVCQLVVQSRTADNPEGAEIRSEGGTLSEPVPCGIAPGSIMSVRNIFFNIPARRKFLKSPTTEFGHISEMVNRLVIPNHEICFIFRHNGKIVYELPPATPLERLNRIFGSEVAQKLIYVESRRGDVHVFGYVGHPDSSRANYNLQYFFLNKRFIKDRSLQHALSEAYRGLLPVGRFPVAFLQIEVPPDFVDVNVHPTKMEVRFLNSSTIYSGFLGAIREEFLRCDLRSRPSLDHSDNQDSGHSSDIYGKKTGAMTDKDSTDPQKAMADSTIEEMRSKILNWNNAVQASASSSRESTASPLAPSFSDQKSGTPLADDSALTGSGGKSTGSGRVSDFIPYPDSGGRFPGLGSLAARASGGFSSGNISSGNSSASLQNQEKPRQINTSDQDHINGYYDNEESPYSGGESDLVLHKINRNSNRENIASSPSVGNSVNNSSEQINPVSLNNSSTLSGTLAFPSQESPSKQQSAQVDQAVPVIQIQQRYLVMEVEQGMAVIDQHALHERILYEKIKERMEKGPLDSQLLIVPEAADLSPIEIACALENKELFETFGLQIGEFGGNTLIISGYPSILERVPPREILFLLLEPLLAGGKKPERTDLFDSMMHQMACKAAIKAGEHLSPDMINELLEQAQNEINSHHCPHGRPSTLIFTCQELDKMFKRT